MQQFLDGVVINNLIMSQHQQEITQILDEMMGEESLQPNQLNDIIWLLWHQRKELAKQLKEWEICLQDLGIDHKNIKSNLKVTQ